MAERDDRYEDEDAVNRQDAVRRTAGGDPRPERHGGMLYTLLLVAAIAIIVFSIIGIATVTGVVPGGASGASMRSSDSEVESGRTQRIDTPRREPLPRPGNPRTAMWAGAEKAA